MSRLFTGINTSHGEAADAASLETPTTAITIGAWIYPSSGGDGQTNAFVLVKTYTGIGSADPYYSYGIYRNGGTARQYLGGLNKGSGTFISTAGTSTLAADTWHLLAMRWASGEKIQLLQFDSSFVLQQTVESAATFTGTLAYSTGKLWVGGTDTFYNNTFGGRIARVGVHNAKLTDQEIIDLFKSDTPALTCSGTFNPMNEASGSTCADSTGNGNTLTCSDTTVAGDPPTQSSGGVLILPRRLRRNRTLLRM